ncbi:flagellar filament capping protein FliD [Pseudoduganella violacea]|uniref:Flagellar hook-associated protein 2 n=1 Tax=Pseudoduganella violacea TaxID=1715466 RepID=A0A7W5FVI1_9BURK|nr:flagellar filament capping protein FliD [Pseudoduganella violacea]MBB3120829.1 flagellar hook-associated protein 2 [Pseudoduganella violacea]
MAITSPVYDPVPTATKMANKYMAGAVDRQNAAVKDLQSDSTGLSKVSSAIKAFEAALSAMSTKKSVIANAATFSSAVGTATANATASPGSYSFYVEKLATAGQVSYGGITDTTAAGSGTLKLVLGDGSNFTVDLASADKDMNGTLTAKEIAAAINVAASNNSRITASTLTINGQSTLVLSSNATGAANGVASLDVSAVNDPALKAALGAPKVLQGAQDAEVWVGPQGTGQKIVQASNTFSGMIDGVTMTFTKAQGAGEAPVTLTVGSDSAGTNANVQAFVDAYNKLDAVLRDVTNPGDPKSGLPAGPFAGDSGLLSLRNGMKAVMRQALGTQSLVTYGIKGTLNGSIELDTSRLAKALAADPTSLDKLFGSASLVSPSGVLGSMDKLMDQWTDLSKGQLVTRRGALDKLQIKLTAKQADLDRQYDGVYKRYLDQYTKLQTLQAQMTGSSSLFDALFGNKSSN